MIAYRPATPEDVLGIDRVFRAAYNELNRSRGFAELPPGPPNPFFAFAIAEEAAGCSVAEENGAIVGVSIASCRGPAWFLAFLFIDPACQAKGVGRRLIERALAHGGDKAGLRTLITFAYNPVAVSLYLRYGMLPLEPLYAFEAAAADLRERLAGGSPIARETAAPGAASAAPLAAIDGPILGMDRTRLHRFLLGAPGSICHLFRAEGAICGYAYVSASGRVGPVAAAAPLSFESVLDVALAQAAAVSRDRVSTVLAGSNAPAVAAVIGHGMRITTPLLLMASRRFGDLDRYAFHSPGLM